MNEREQLKEIVRWGAAWCLCALTIGTLAFGVIGFVVLLDHTASVISAWLIKRYGDVEVPLTTLVFAALSATAACVVLLLASIFRSRLRTVWSSLRLAIAPISPAYIRQAVDARRLPSYYRPLRGRILLMVLALNLMLMVFLWWCGLLH